MTYYAIRGIAGGGIAYAVKTQLADVPVLSPSHHEIFDVTLFTLRQDAQDAIDELQHKVAKQCAIVIVDVREMVTEGKQNP